MKYGHFGDYLKTWKKLDAVMRDRGWVETRLLVPTAGADNEIIAEFEYPDLATFERENKAFFADQEAFEAFRAGAEFVVEGTARTELYEDIPMDFPEVTDRRRPLTGICLGSASGFLRTRTRCGTQHWSTANVIGREPPCRTASRGTVPKVTPTCRDRTGQR